MDLNSGDRFLKIYKKNQKKDLSISLTSNASFYEGLNDNTKSDIIFLINSGYEKNTIIKLYLYLMPSDVNEAAHYLSKINGIYQHNFYPSNKDDNNNCCICGEEKEFHLNQINNLKSSGYNDNNSISFPIIQPQIIEVKSKLDIDVICKICEFEITRHEKINNKCEQCNNHFCDECLYYYIKESIKNGKYDLVCPECKHKYTEQKVNNILSYGDKNDKKEISKLKQLLKVNNTKKLVLSNQNLMFCPIVDCDGYGIRNDKDSRFCICNNNHKFCVKCKELWHKSGKCPKEEEIDKLFEQFTKKYNVKKCPNCQIVTLKRGGCNHITCTYCKKDWCWLCGQLFRTTEEHYDNINNKCYNKMMNNDEIIICPKCNNETNSFKIFNKCEHLICNDCFEDCLLLNENKNHDIKCILEECNEISYFGEDVLINFINERNNNNLKKNIKIYFF